MLELVLECFVGLCLEWLVRVWNGWFGFGKVGTGLEWLVRVWKGWAWFGIFGLDLMYISELFYVFGSVWFG